VNVSANAMNRDIQVDGVKKLDKNAALTILTADGLTDINSFSQPYKVKPKEQELKLKGKKLSVPLAPYSLTVVRVKIS
jgi:alpha-N-arabinofuranosidase